MKKEALKAFLCDEEGKVIRIKAPVAKEQRDEFFPLLRKIANESRKIRSTERSCKIYHMV